MVSLCARLVSTVLFFGTMILVPNAVVAQGVEMIPITLDQATILRLEAPATSLVIGNPAIADAIVQDGKTLVITGKGYGSTNLIGLDTNGRQLFERQLVVRAPEQTLVTIYRGTAGALNVDRETVSCAPKCQPAVMIGDSGTAFSGALGQTSSRNSLSQSQAASSPQ